MLKAKYQPSDQQVQEMDDRMEHLADLEGLEYHLTDAGLTGSTLDAHQLLELGKDRGIQDAVVERLYRAYSRSSAPFRASVARSPRTRGGSR
jgi:predicted DsbA family dithiol-disulfide isomerase